MPAIRAAGFEVRVNAYVVGRTRRVVGALGGGGSRSGSAEGESSPGCQGGVTDLWYLSLVGARGQGTTLRALWANLVSNHNRAVWLEGIGSVMLGQHRLDLAGLGYPIPWTYRQAMLMPSRDVQGVLESDLLTCHDPLLVPATSRASRRHSDHAAAARRRRGAGHGRIAPVPGSHQDAGGDTSGHAAGSDTQGRGGGGAAARGDGRVGGITLSTASGSGEEAHAVAAREARPLFLLLVRGAGGTDQASLSRLHLRYLAARMPWLPYYPAWADYLWQRARERREAEELAVWSYGMPNLPMAGPRPGSGASGPASGEPDSHAGDDAAPRSVLAAAYLCKPDPLALTEDLRRAIAGGRFSSLRAGTPGMAGERAA